MLRGVVFCCVACSSAPLTAGPALVTSGWVSTPAQTRPVHGESPQTSGSLPEPWPSALVRGRGACVQPCMVRLSQRNAQGLAMTRRSPAQKTAGSESAVPVCCSVSAALACDASSRPRRAVRGAGRVWWSAWRCRGMLPATHGAHVTRGRLQLCAGHLDFFVMRRFGSTQGLQLALQGGQLLRDLSQLGPAAGEAGGCRAPRGGSGQRTQRTHLQRSVLGAAWLASETWPRPCPGSSAAAGRQSVGRTRRADPCRERQVPTCCVTKSGALPTSFSFKSMSLISACVRGPGRPGEVELWRTAKRRRNARTFLSATVTLKSSSEKPGPELEWTGGGPPFDGLAMRVFFLPVRTAAIAPATAFCKRDKLLCESCEHSWKL